MADKIINDFQVVMDEAHTEDHSTMWRQSASNLRRIHPDLADIAIMGAKRIPQSDSLEDATRFSNVAMRELSSLGENQLSEDRFKLAMIRTNRGVLIQQSAEHILTERTGTAQASDFLSLKQTVEDSARAPGNVAIAALSRQGIDARRLFNGMNDQDMRAVSAGSYDRVSPEHRDKLISALETPTKESTKTNEREHAALPVVRPQRTQFTSPRQNRMPSFGQRVAAHQNLSQGM